MRPQPRQVGPAEMCHRRMRLGSFSNAVAQCPIDREERRGNRGEGVFLLCSRLRTRECQHFGLLQEGTSRDGMSIVIQTAGLLLVVTGRERVYSLTPRNIP